METIKSLAGIEFSVIFEAFKEAFSDYEVQLNELELQRMLKRRSFNPDLSFAAFDDDKIVSFTLNGIGKYRSKKTAYDTGTGTLKAYRGKGLATKIFEYSVPFLKEAGVEQYLLEVLQHNDKAVSVYKKIGFEVSREFYYHVIEGDSFEMTEKPLDSEYSVEEVELFINRSMIDGFGDYYPSWQNTFVAMSVNLDHFKMVAAYKSDELIGYCFVEPQAGDIPQLVVASDHRRKGIGSTLLKEALKLNEKDSFKIINTDITCESMFEFLKAHGIEPRGKQFEMIKTL
ncbi:GNAT family N-acetyltransferase [Puteibacter caeruleilacunae]|nr:GNAT family N-acetyltransferase [Puteibacter caeruleilacunae]